ncbi:hypothetical protein J5226_24470 [Lysobacter sp. K5869]|uniref:hypothetical protein n=1 Tax=Lysobacter sp. K5869 TaxID=2820808 RepID=UPI001C063653|nr:hypothetical protein [Lysobacter sp. K5869]QWP76693.1 hypothetical protein J5226_24470 [Lysobacter sp. K5869]
MASIPQDRRLPDFGPKLTRDEYERRIVALHEGAPPLPSDEEERRARRGELELLIDYRLGQDFPQARRDALWRLQSGLDKRRFWHLLTGLVAHPGDPSAGLAKAQVRAFGEVLDSLELGELLELTPEELERLR